MENWGFRFGGDGRSRFSQSADRLILKCEKGGVGLTVMVGIEGAIEAGIGENARLCMGGEVRRGNGVGTC